MQKIYALHIDRIIFYCAESFSIVLPPISLSLVFLTFGETLCMNLTIDTEQEAAVAMLFSCVMYKHKNLTQSQIDQLSRIVVLCSKFKGTDLNELTIKAISLQAQQDAKSIIEESAPLISEEFRETLFAMICEVMTNKGSIDETESEVIGMVALYLNIPVERMRIILTAFLIRNKWNVQIIEEMHG
jgi:uncharacterized tellurite resistance protein B-like protein